ncbi:hypothetical protein KHU50_009976 [Colletotrichum sp. SAR 10_65]|nr:hypothetical protein KHU50_009976 [Colletotrichum sp. SAR 10_65]KAI8172707.1 hypothetical protein K4K51_010713 [Colletotrichum sp. SAR 10_75]
MPTSPPYLRGYPAEQRRDAWLQWAFENISPVFKRFPGERAYVVFQLENLEWIGNCGLPPANSDSDAWCRLKQTWGPSEPPPKGTIPSVADCEVVRLLNKGYVHEYIELNLRKHGWDPYKCCDPSLKVEQKRLNAPSPAKPSSSAAATPASTGVHSQSRPAAEKDSKTQSPASENLQTTVTPKEEHLRANDDLHKNNIERMSAKLFKNFRPTLHAYLRDEIEAMSKTVMGNMRKRTVEVLGRQSNSHLGFATLRDVEDLTLAMMEAEINSVRKATLEQIDKLDKQGSDVPIKREASDLEEGGVAEHAREAKRQRTSNSASSQDCVQS